MKLYRSSDVFYLQHNAKWYEKRDANWDSIINRKNLRTVLEAELEDWHQIDQLPNIKIKAPIVNQEVWAAGVTYLRSKVARMEEAEAAGGGDFYDRVYDADRPEIFFKATAARTVGPDEEVYIRSDSTWNVPEPELTLFCCSDGTIEGYTIGNDVSSRSIEGENPLYLPQAKTYDRSAALGPCILIPESPISQETQIYLKITRIDHVIFEDSVSIAQMKRSLTELASYLFRACTFKHGCYLMTGTCLVPGDDFTLMPGDLITISIDGIGTLSNTAALLQIKT